MVLLNTVCGKLWAKLWYLRCVTKGDTKCPMLSHRCDGSIKPTLLRSANRFSLDQSLKFCRLRVQITFFVFKIWYTFHRCWFTGILLKSHLGARNINSRLGVKMTVSLEIRQASRQQRCRNVWQISKLDNSKSRSHSFRVFARSDG